MMPRNKIKYLLDVEGFFVNKRFLIKELAYLDLDDVDERIASYYFRVGSFLDLRAGDRRQARYLFRHVHGLPFLDFPEDHEQSDAVDLIRYLCENARHMGRLVAYKGGNIERDIIRRLGYGDLAYNIELLGCPTYANLVSFYGESVSRAVQRRDVCARHTGIRRTAMPHCPRAELRYFARFIREIT